MSNSHTDLQRFVLILYKIRKPQCLHRTGSLPLITFLAPQSPHRYSTPEIIVGIDEVCPPKLLLPGSTMTNFVCGPDHLLMKK